MSIGLARFPFVRDLDGFDFAAQPSIDKKADPRDRGISVQCPSNVTDNTAVNNGTNLFLQGDGCNNTNNVAPSSR